MRLDKRTSDTLDRRCRHWMIDGRTDGRMHGCIDGGMAEWMAECGVLHSGVCVPAKELRLIDTVCK